MAERNREKQRARTLNVCKFWPNIKTTFRVEQHPADTKQPRHLTGVSSDKSTPTFMHLFCFVLVSISFEGHQKLPSSTVCCLVLWKFFNVTKTELKHELCTCLRKSGWIFCSSSLSHVAQSRKKSFNTNLHYFCMYQVRKLKEAAHDTTLATTRIPRLMGWWQVRKRLESILCQTLPFSSSATRLVLLQHMSQSSSAAPQ